jgi:hypothetical protein
MKVDTGRLGQLGSHPAMVILPLVVHKAQLRRNPADAAFD